MRVIGLILVVVIASFGSIASADKVKTNQEAKLLNHPGEQGAVLLNLKEGQTMTLLSVDGRWLKVRVQGRTGFVPRSKVDMPDNTAIARNTRRQPFVDGRGMHRGSETGAAPDDRIGIDATGDVASKGGDDDGDAKKPVAKKPPPKSGDDDDDASKKPAAKKPAVKPAVKTGDDDDDDDTAKKPAAKKPPPVAKKPAAPAAKSGDDDDDDDTAKKPAAKKPPPVAKKPAAKSGDDDDDDDDTAKKPAKPAAKKPTVVATKAPAKKSGDDDDDDDSGSKKKLGDDDDRPSPKRPQAHVGADSKVFEDRSDKSSVAFVAKPDEKLYVDSTKGDWTTVENDDGDTGWIRSSELLVDDASDHTSTRSNTIDAGARLGATLIQQSMSTAGSTLTGTDQVPDKYNIKASAATIAIGADMLVPFGKKLSLGGELTYDLSKTVGGGVVYMGSQTGFTIHNVNLRALAAYDFQRPSGMMLIGHLGFRYRAYLVNDYADLTKNTAKIPQETLKAPTIGAALAIPRLGQSFGLQVGIDAILFGSGISQTAGLEDGQTPSMMDYELNARFVYHLKSQFDIVAMYDLDYGSYDFGPMNMESTRGHTGTDVTRTDIINMLTVGLAKGF